MKKEESERVMTTNLDKNLCGAEYAPQPASTAISREVLPVTSDCLGWLLRRSFVPIIMAAVLLVVGHLGARQLAGRRVVIISVPSPVPWMCEDRGHRWARCWWTDEKISAALSVSADQQPLGK